jgi:tetratricopeptide (TPR) repeat protein
MDSYKRISFLISKRDEIGLKLVAEKKGMTMAGLIREWVLLMDDWNFRTVKESMGGPITTYNLRLDARTYHRIMSTAKENGLRLSTFLRTLIFEGLAKTEKKLINFDMDQIPVRNLWLKGELGLLKGLLENKLEILHNEELIMLAKIYLELGYGSELVTILNYIKQRKVKDGYVSPLDLVINLIEAERLVINGKFVEGREIAKNIIKTATDIRLKDVVGKAYFLLALVSSGERNARDGMRYIQKSLEYFDIFNNPIEIAKSYLYATDFLEFEENYSEADKYYFKSKEIFESLANNYYMGWYYGGRAFNKYIRNDFDKSAKYAAIATKLDSKSMSVKQLRYSTTVLAKTLLCQGKFEEARINFEKTVDMEKRFITQKPSINELYLLLVKSRFSPENIQTMKSLIAVESDRRNYLLSSAKYLFGKNVIERESGRDDLELMAIKSDDVLFLKSIDMTLKTKRVQPIIF